MNQLQLIFLAPLAIAAAVIALSDGSTSYLSNVKYWGLVGSCWITAALLLYLSMAVLTPEDPVKFLPTLVVAYAAPILTIALVLRRPAQRWPRVWRISLALGLAGALSVVAIIFLVISTCVVQGNCL